MSQPEKVRKHRHLWQPDEECYHCGYYRESCMFNEGESICYFERECSPDGKCEIVAE